MDTLEKLGLDGRTHLHSAFGVSGHYLTTSLCGMDASDTDTQQDATGVKCSECVKLAAARREMEEAIVEARKAMTTEFKAEAARLGATVRTVGDRLVASWLEVAGQATIVTLAVVGEHLALTETAALRVPARFPEELLQRFGHRAAVASRLRDHLAMVERATGVPMLAPPEPLRVVAA